MDSQKTYQELLKENQLLKRKIESVKSDELYHTYFEKSSDAHMVLEGDRIIECNPATVKLFRYKLKENIIGSYPWILSPEKQPDGESSEIKAKKIIATALKKGAHRFEWLHKKRDGKLFPAEVLFNVITNNIIYVTIHDISKYKRLMTSLQESEERFRELSYMSFEGIVVHENGIVVNANLTFEKVTGYSRDEIIGANVVELFIPPKYREVVIENMKKKYALPYEVEAMHKSGKLVPVEIESVNVKIKNRNARVTAIRDITEKKKNRLALEKSQAKYKEVYELYRLMADTTSDMIWAKDMEGKFTFTNKAICDRLLNAKDTSEPIGKHVMFFVNRERDSHPENKMWFTFGEECGDSDAITIRNKKISHFIEYGNVFGKYLVLDVYKAPLWDENGNMIGTVGSARDITKQLEAENNLKKSEDKFRKAFSTSPDVISISELETGKYFDINESFLKILNYKREEVIGKTAIELGLWKDVRSREELIKILNRDGYVKNFETEFVRRDGTIKHVLLSGAIIELSGKPYLLSIARDITKSVIAQNELKKLNQKLIKQNEEYEKLNNNLRKSMEQIREINRELKEAKRKAEESDLLKSAFLANMSHEIRTPMNGILGFSSLLRNMDLSENEKNYYLDIIESSGKRLLNLINDLIDISKIESGQMPIKLSTCNISSKLEELYRFFSLEANQKGLILRCDKKADLIKTNIITDTTKFVVIFTNLLKNAIKYTPKGTITFGGQLKGDFIEFFVKDTGIGIPKDRIDAVFDRFVQADIKDRDAYEGAGLGLAITKAYVKMLNGDIWVESTEGKGSTFYFTLPVVQGVVKNTGNNGTIVNMPVKRPEKLKILVVEDEMFSSELVSILIRKIAAKIYYAKNGKEAVEIFKKYPDIDLVLMDIKLPVMDGFEASNAIRKIDKNVKIIAQTAYALSGDKEKAMAAGFNAYITKPIDRNSLLKEIELLFNN